MNRLQRRKLKRSANLKLLFFTFVGAFIFFFAAFTYILPAITPKVEIPALSEDHAFNSITSQDFKGRIDPRLRSIELKEETDDQNRTKTAKKAPPRPTRMIFNNVSHEDQKHNAEAKTTKAAAKIPLPGSEISYSSENKAENTVKQDSSEINNKVSVHVPPVPPRPRPVVLKKNIDIVPPAPVFQAKVIVGNFSSPKEAKMTSDILLNLDFRPFIRERSGKYIIQVGSFADTEKAKEMVKVLKNRNFDARIIYE